VGPSTPRDRWAAARARSVTRPPVQVLTGIVAIAAGGHHNLALSGSGILYAWGANSSGQLGNGSTSNRTTPTIVQITNVRAIAACDEHSLAIKNDGSVWGLGCEWFWPARQRLEHEQQRAGAGHRSRYGCRSPRMRRQPQPRSQGGRRDVRVGKQQQQPAG
jgi:alpha-tubulin suppressor-like RCC1 family protein